MTARLLLLLALAWVAFNARSPADTQRRLAARLARHGRARVLLGLSMAQILGFAGSAVAGLLLLGRDPLQRMPPEFVALAARVGYDGPIGHATGLFFVAECAVMPIAAGFAAGYRRRRGRAIARGPMSELLPQARNELVPATLLAVAAGVSEEVFFRLFVPLAAILSGVSAWVAIPASVALFGAAHRGQGSKGVIVTTIIGLLLTWFYLISGSLWLAMAFHAAFDLAALVAGPAAAGAWKNRSNTPVSLVAGD